MTTITFDVIGIPQPGGSKKAFMHPHLRRIMIVDANSKAKNWKDTVRTAAVEAYRGPIIHGPLRLYVTFYMPRPKGHWRTGRNAGELKPNAPKYPTTKPDASKILRSTEDALTKIIWQDDAQVVVQTVCKEYADGPPGAKITIEELL